MKMLGQTLKTKCFRIEHVRYGISNRGIYLGPYRLIKHFPELFDEDDVKRLKALMRKNEPPSTLIGGGISPVLWNHPRPGLNEDPYLRDWYTRRSEQERDFGAFVVVACDKTQLDGWMGDYEMKTLLKQMEFTVRKYVGWVRVGLCQGVMDVTREFRMISKCDDLMR